jgi:hypothetical protein
MNFLQDLMMTVVLECQRLVVSQQKDGTSDCQGSWYGQF